MLLDAGGLLVSRRSSSRSRSSSSVRLPDRSALAARRLDDAAQMRPSRWLGQTKPLPAEAAVPLRILSTGGSPVAYHSTDDGVRSVPHHRRLRPLLNRETSNHVHHTPPSPRHRLARAGAALAAVTSLGGLAAGTASAESTPPADDAVGIFCWKEYDFTRSGNTVTRRRSRTARTTRSPDCCPSGSTSSTTTTSRVSRAAGSRGPQASGWPRHLHHRLPEVVPPLGNRGDHLLLSADATR